MASVTDSRGPVDRWTLVATVVTRVELTRVDPDPDTEERGPQRLLQLEGGRHRV